MSFDRRITPVRADLADERLRGQVEAERFTAGTLKRVVALLLAPAPPSLPRSAGRYAGDLRAKA